MPNYHFRIKSSNRSATKSVKASDHCDYINREGRFRDCDETSKEKLSCIPQLAISELLEDEQKRKNKYKGLNKDGSLEEFKIEE